jgi:hypothetical protein
MLLRHSLKGTQSDDDYLSGRSHPTVFDNQQLDVERMVRLAHELTPEEIPPLVGLRVAEEDATTPGVDYFDAGPAEKLLDAPCAIARVARAARYRRRMRVRAEAAPDAGGALEFQWRLLRGDPARVELKPTADGRECEITVAWHERRSIQEGSELQSCRVDIGVFARHARWYSAPSLVCWLFPANEQRTYDQQGRILSIERHAADTPARYVDPAVVVPAVWRDEYHHDPQGRLLGWSRTRDGKLEEFTRHGALVQSRDAQHRPLEARMVRYVRQQASASAAPRIVQQPSDEVLTYRYASVGDQLGEIASRRLVTPVQPSDSALPDSKP